MSVLIANSGVLKYSGMGNITPTDAEICLKLRRSGSQADNNRSNVIYGQNSSGNETFRFEISEAAGVFTWTFIAFHGTGTSPETKQTTGTLTFTVDTDYSIRLLLGSGTSASTEMAFYWNDVLQTPGSSQDGSGTMRALDAIWLGNRFGVNNTAFAGYYAELLYSSGGLSSDDQDSYDGNTENPLFYESTRTLYRSLRTNSSQGWGTGTFTSSGTFSFDAAVLTAMPKAPVVNDNQTLIRAPRKWPTNADKQKGIARNSNTNPSFDKDKAAGFCAIEHEGTWYYFGEFTSGTSRTVIYRLSSTSPLGPFEFTDSPPTDVVFDPADYTDANDEAAVTTVMPNPWVPGGLIAFLHCGNNGTATRNVYFATSNDPTGAPGSWTPGNNGDPIIESGIDSYDTYSVADAFGWYDAEDDVIRLFYRASAASNQTAVALATFDSSENVVKLGVVIPYSTWSSKNGPVPGGVWESEPGVLQMLLSANDPTGGVGHTVSYTKGVLDSWATRATVGSPTGTAADADATNLGDGVCPMVDDRHPELVLFGVGAENVGGSYPDGSPVRGRWLYAAPRARDISQLAVRAKFYGNAFSGARAQTTVAPAVTPTNSSTFLIAAKVRAHDFDRNKYREVYTFEAAFNKGCYLRIEGGGGANAGKVGGYLRTPTALMSMVGTSVIDDGLDHTIALERVANNDWNLWVDGVIEATSTTNPTTDATAGTSCIGNWASATGEPNEPFLGAIASVHFITGTPPETAQAVANAVAGTVYSGGTSRFLFPTDGTDSGPVAEVEFAATQEIETDEVAGAEAFGTTSVGMGIDAGSVTSEEAFGTVSLGQELGAEETAGAEAFGTTSVGMGIDAGSVTSGEAFGTASFDLEIQAEEIASAEAFGGAAVTVDDQLSVLPEDTASGEAFGSPSLGQSIQSDDIASAEAFGSPSLSLNSQQEIDADGVVSAEAFGTTSLGLEVEPESVASAEAFGTNSLGAVIAAGSVTSEEAFGTQSLGRSIAAEEIASAEAFGTASVGQRLEAEGIAGAEDFGIASLELEIGAGSIASSEDFGGMALGLDISDAGEIATAEALGSPNVLVGIVAGDIESLESLGSPAIANQVNVPAYVSPSNAGNRERQILKTPRRTAGLALPIGVSSRGGIKLVYGDEQNQKLISISLSDNDNDNPWHQGRGLGEAITFGLDDIRTRSDIVRRLKFTFSLFEAAKRFKLREETIAFPEGKEGETILEFKYVDLEANEEKDFRKQFSGGGRR